MKVKNRKTSKVYNCLVFQKNQIIIQIKNKNGVIKKMWIDPIQFRKKWIKV